MRYHPIKALSLWLYCAIACLFWGCSNSEGINYAEWDERDFVRTSSNVIEEYNNSSIVQPSEESDIFSSTKAINHLSISSEKSEPSSSSNTINHLSVSSKKNEPSSSSNAINHLSVSSEKNELSSSSKNIDKLPLDDTEYPYAGIPRIVIETEGHREIKDRETEIPAKLQIWGEKAPESEIMKLTIKGRGNSTWNKPKKPYTIKFEHKQEFMGMKKAKKWVLLANYLDRTLIRNATALEIARKTSLEWVPSGKFAEVFLNGKFLGNYFVCEKVQINENRLNINDDSFLLEFDKNYDEDYKFKTSIRNLPVYIKNPDIPSEDQIAYITAYIDTIECILYGECKNLAIESYLDLQSFADYFIVYELTENTEPKHPKSVYMYKDSGPLKAGPVWDFDWGTFIESKINGWQINNTLWFDKLLSNSTFKMIAQTRWVQYRSDLEKIQSFIDSLATYTRESNDRNIAMWPIKTSSTSFPDKDKNFEEAILMMKQTYSARIKALEELFTSLH